MDINLNDIKSAADFENKLNQIAEAFDGNFIIKTRGNDTLSVQKSSFFGRLWQWLQGRSAQERKVDDLISGFLLQNKDRFYDVLKKSENSSVRRYSKFLKKEMVDRIEDKSIELKSQTNSFKVNALFFSRFPYFSNTTREKMKNQDSIPLSIPLDEFSDQVIEHLIESTNGLKNLESLPMDKWAEFYALADYLGMTSLQDEVMVQLTEGLSRSEPEAYIPPFIELLTIISEPDRHISKLIESLDRQSSAYLKDFFEAINNLEPEDKEGRVISFLLANAYDKGLGVKQDHSKAFQWYKKSADQGLSRAQYILGVFYERGLTVEQDYEKAFECYKKATDQGCSDATHFRDRLMTYVEYKKLADQGSVEAQYKLGNLYCNGIGINRDYAQTVKDDAKAFEWYKKAADQGSAEAQCELGVLYRKGFGIKQDYAKAFEWFKKSADQGLSKAQYELGVLYENGIGVQRDYKQAFEYYKKAADQGRVNASSGRDRLKNYVEYKKLADQGSVEAQNELGLLYYNGIGIERDYRMAFVFFKKAAEGGLSVAEYNLGFMYYWGKGVEMSYNKALKWFKKAAKQGYEKAIIICKSEGVSYN